VSLLLKFLQFMIIFLFLRNDKAEPKAGDEIARYDTSFIAIPPSLPSRGTK
jgi:hypothetical protein